MEELHGIRQPQNAKEDKEAAGKVKDQMENMLINDMISDFHFSFEDLENNEYSKLPLDSKIKVQAKAYETIKKAKEEHNLSNKLINKMSFEKYLTLYNPFIEWENHVLTQGLDQNHTSSTWAAFFNKSPDAYKAAALEAHERVNTNDGELKLS